MAKLWIENCKPDISEMHRLRYIGYIENRLNPFLENIKLKDLKLLHLQKVINTLNDLDMSTSTMKHVKLIATQILETSIDNNLLIKNVFRKVAVPSKPPKERRALNEKEIRMITENWNGHRMSLAAMIMLYCGLRRGEVIALDWDDIQLEQRMITVSKSAQINSNQPKLKLPKTQAGIRRVPIPEVLMVALRHCEKKSGHVCTMTDGISMITGTGWSRGWSSYLYYLNLRYGGKPATGGKGITWVIDKHITPHMLRHTYATLLFDAGVDVKSTQKYFGHSCLEVTLETYTHLSKFKQEQSLDALDKHLTKSGMEKASKAKAV